MLSRRTFLTTLAAAPLVKFCGTEPVRPYEPRWIARRVVMKAAHVERLYGLRPGTLSSKTLPPDIFQAIDGLMEIHGRQLSLHRARVVLKNGATLNFFHSDRKMSGDALPQGTLG